MNRIPAEFNNAGEPRVPGVDPELVARSVREPALLRLAQSIEDLNPELARALCLSGLAAMTDPDERDAWRARLAPWLDDREDDDGGGGGTVLAAA